jgi:hypothetical protein
LIRHNNAPASSQHKNAKRLIPSNLGSNWKNASDLASTITKAPTLWKQFNRDYYR